MRIFTKSACEQAKRSKANEERTILDTSCLTSILITEFAFKLECDVIEMNEGPAKWLLLGNFQN